MPMINPFATDAFDMVALTAAINKIPNTYGRLEQLNLMPPQGVRLRTIIIEEMSGVLNLLPTQPVGAPGTVGTTGKRKVRSFVIPHIPHDDTVLPEEVQGIRAFGSETETDALANLLAQKLRMDAMPKAFAIMHDFRELALLSQRQIAALYVAAFGHQNKLLARNFREHFSQKALGAAIAIIGAGVNEIATPAKIVAQGSFMLGIRVEHTVTTEANRMAV